MKGKSSFGLGLRRVLMSLVWGVVYFALFTPLAAALRLSGRRPLAMRPDPAADSYWMARPTAAPGGMTRQF